MEQALGWVLGLLIAGGVVYAVSAVVYIIRFSKKAKYNDMNNNIPKSSFLNNGLACSNEGNSEFPVEQAISQLGSSFDSLITKECGMEDDS